MIRRVLAAVVVLSGGAVLAPACGDDLSLGCDPPMPSCMGQPCGAACSNDPCSARCEAACPTPGTCDGKGGCVAPPPACPMPGPCMGKPCGASCTPPGMPPPPGPHACDPTGACVPAPAMCL